MSQSILVTGGAGYIGAHACKLLARAGYRPVVFDNLSRGHREAVRWGPLVEGDLIAFKTAGAYGAVMASTYNTRRLVPEVLVQSNRYAVVRPRPSYEDMLKAETIAPWLR